MKNSTYVPVKKSDSFKIHDIIRPVYVLKFI
jgi:hypothetical protein